MNRLLSATMRGKKGHGMNTKSLVVSNERLSMANSQFTPLWEGETNRDSAFATGTH